MLTIEIDGPKNECLSFRPLQTNIRGRYDFARDSEPYARQAMTEFPSGIPGRRIGYDSDKECGFVEESLHDDAHETVCEIIERKGFKLSPKVEEFPDVDETTWTYWMSRAVESGIARVVAGKLPAKFDMSKVQKDFIVVETPTDTDKLTAAIEKQTEVFERLISKLSA